MTRQHRVPSMPARGFAIPLCRVHLTKCQRNEDGEWFCLACFQEHVEHIVRARSGRKTKSGIELPYGVLDPAKENIDVREVLPNRAERRRRLKIRKRLERKNARTT